jgi:Family of unknown function (DUF6459)
MDSAAPPHVPSKHEPQLPASSLPTIRELVVPQTAPPYDDEPVSYPPAGADGQDQLGQNPQNSVRPPDRHKGRPAEPDPWPRQFAQVLAETLAGVRPAQQLTPWTSERARRQIRQLGPLLASGQLPRVRRIMTSAPATDALEITAVVGCGDRVRVIAVRLDRDRASGAGAAGGWSCTAVESA